MNYALAMLECGLQGLAQRGFIGGVDQHVGHWQLDGVLLESVYAREACGWQKFTVHAQVREAARARPVGQFGVNTFAVDNQRRQQADVLTAVVFEQLRGDALGALRHHCRAVVRAMLNAELHIQQA